MTDPDNNITLTVTDNHTTNLSSDDLNALTELINSENSNNETYNNQGIIIGASLLGAGLLLSGVSMFLAHPKDYPYRKSYKNICSTLAVPLTTTGLIMTIGFVLKKNKTQ